MLLQFFVLCLSTHTHITLWCAFIQMTIIALWLWLCKLPMNSFFLRKHYYLKRSTLSPLIWSESLWRLFSSSREREREKKMSLVCFASTHKQNQQVCVKQTNLTLPIWFCSVLTSSVMIILIVNRLWASRVFLKSTTSKRWQNFSNFAVWFQRVTHKSIHKYCNNFSFFFLPSVKRRMYARVWMNHSSVCVSNQHNHSKTPHEYWK